MYGDEEERSAREHTAADEVNGRKHDSEWGRKRMVQ